MQCSGGGDRMRGGAVCVQCACRVWCVVCVQAKRGRAEGVWQRACVRVAKRQAVCVKVCAVCVRGRGGWW